MQRKIRVAAVSYLNTKPLIYGFENGEMCDCIKLSLEYPAVIAKLLSENKIDIGLLPVAAIKDLKEAFLIGTHGIASAGPVASVCLFSEVPLQEIETVFLDYQSRTSVELLRILMAKHWHISPRILNGTAGFEQNISGKTAALVIGDRAFLLRKKHKFIFDLAEEWRVFSSLPFVFAAWIANKAMPPEFIAEFDLATSVGLNHLPEIINRENYPLYDLNNYYTRNITYLMGTKEIAGLTVFLDLIGVTFTDADGLSATSDRHSN